MKLQNYIKGNWHQGNSDGIKLLNAVNSKLVAIADSSGIDFSSTLSYAREVGNKALRSMTFHQRAYALKELALHLLKNKKEFYKLSSYTGATKLDSWIDIEGGIGNLFVMSSKGRRELPDQPFYIDGNTEILSKKGSFIGHHICVPKKGVAIHINAFNFPVWGMLEKIAVNLLAGMPAIIKPATATSYLTQIVFKSIIDSKILPEGSLQLICGNAREIIDHVNYQDVITFTGSSATGKLLKSSKNIIEYSIPFNMEADSLNCSILGPDVDIKSENFSIFIKEVVKEMTVKTGQKCTAIRRVIVPLSKVEAVKENLIKSLKEIVIGDPMVKGVKMGPLATFDQRVEVLNNTKELLKHCELLMGANDDFNIVGSDIKSGAFVNPTVLYCENPTHTLEVHSTEAFGPVTTIIPYTDTHEAIELANMGEGSLVGSVITNDEEFARDVVINTSPYHGRLLVLNKDCAKESTGHGSPMPQLVHGGPGRAGGGEELGGIRAIFHYMQRTAIQGHPSMITNITNRYQINSKQTYTDTHPFKKYFEDLSIGETLITKKREITSEDIDKFADLSGDHFYAHKDNTNFEGTLFEQKVAHGYFIISAAAGLFVFDKKGPVLANYGIDEFYFLKPVYVGAKIYVKFTVYEKSNQKVKEDDIPRGIVKWLVDVYDQEEESVARGVILTLVAKKLSN